MAEPVDLASLLPQGVFGFASAIPCEAWPLHDAERSAVLSASDRRVQEFTAGRYCAHQAMRQLGIRAAAVPAGSDRAPVWPEGIIGSISHGRSCAAAIVARQTPGLLSLGLDVTEAEPLEADLIARIGKAPEYDLLARLPGLSAGLAAHLLFSLKEAVFKCLYPRTRLFLEFEDLQLLHLAEDQRFTMSARRQASEAPAVLSRGTFAVTSGSICSIATLRPGNPADAAASRLPRA